MKNFHPFVLVFVLGYNFSFAQMGMWTWINGTQNSNDPGHFGTQGVPDSLNTPPSLYEACEWTDLNGYFWLFGGCHLGAAYSDLWKYNPATNMWTWIKGPGIPNETGVYGTQGIPSPNNNPPSTTYGPHSWIDLDGNFWLFGGGGVANGELYSDLWKYDLITNEWTWMKGPGTANQPGSYGVRGISDSTNNPPALQESAASWTDNNGNLWLFGGADINSDNFNGLWSFNIQTNNWTWMKGSDLPNQPSVYGIQGVEDSSNTPSSRWVYSHWKDHKGNFWLFGGIELFDDEDKIDMWRFNPTTNNWTWMSGDSLYDEQTVIATGIKCKPDSANSPSDAVECRASWINADGNFMGIIWSNANYNPIWLYNVETNQWDIISDNTTNASGSWGTKGIPDSTNIPPGTQGAIGWSDRKGDLYLFGGISGGPQYNSLWKFVIDTNCVPVSCQLLSPNLIFNQSRICGSDSTPICVNNSYSSYHWNTGDTTSCIQAKQAGNYYVNVTDNNGCTVQSNPVFIKVNPVNPVSITQKGDTLSSPGGLSYQWLKDGFPINGDTTNICIAKESGSYSVAVTDTNGCNATSSAVVISGINNLNEPNIQLFPNPSTSAWQLTVDESLVGNKLHVYDAEGRLVFQSEIRNPKSEISFSASPGIYFLQIASPQVNIARKLVKL